MFVDKARTPLENDVCSLIDLARVSGYDVSVIHIRTHTTEHHIRLSFNQ